MPFFGLSGGQQAENCPLALINLWSRGRLDDQFRRLMRQIVTKGTGPGTMDLERGRGEFRFPKPPIRVKLQKVDDNVRTTKRIRNLWKKNDRIRDSINRKSRS